MTHTRTRAAALLGAATLALTMTACAGETSDADPTTASSSASSNSEEAPSGDPSLDDAEQAARNLPTFKSAHDAFSGPKFKDYWQSDLQSDMAEYGDSEAEARKYSVTCDKEDEESTAGRDPLTSDVVPGTKMTCWIATTEEEVNVVVYDKAGPEVEECVFPEDMGTCFIGNGWAMWAESRGAMRDTAIKMGVAAQLVEAVSGNP